MQRFWPILFFSLPVVAGPGACAGQGNTAPILINAAPEERDAYPSDPATIDATAGDDDDDDDAAVIDIDATELSKSPPTVSASDGPDVGDDAPADVTQDAADAGCTKPLAPGDLMIDELMISSVAGTGDYGEWVEVKSTLACATNLHGLHGECPRGSKVATFDVTSDVWLPPGGTFVIADSNDETINHDLPGQLFVWFGQPGDVLRNQGSTITLSLNGALIDTLTYPSLSLVVGTSVEFPSDCDPNSRGDFANWQRSSTSWFPGFFGTPNAPNTDVECPSTSLVPTGDAE